MEIAVCRIRSSSQQFMADARLHFFLCVTIALNISLLTIEIGHHMSTWLKIFPKDLKRTINLIIIYRATKPAEERKPIDSKNSTPAHEIKGKEVDSNKMDTKQAPSKDEIVVWYFDLAFEGQYCFWMQLRKCQELIPKKCLFELFPVTLLPMSRAREETKSMITQVTFAVAVLVAGVTFAGAKFFNNGTISTTGSLAPFLLRPFFIVYLQ
ncbi:hypothetical protein NC652_031816 [Populus alba x Populus x berolinensis]|nr:hypothetical protein NC652_031816 [Populus alba x Populus x berolinensis]